MTIRTYDFHCVDTSASITSIIQDGNEDTTNGDAGREECTSLNNTFPVKCDYLQLLAAIVISLYSRGDLVGRHVPATQGRCNGAIIPPL